MGNRDTFFYNEIKSITPRTLNLHHDPSRKTVYFAECLRVCIDWNFDLHIGAWRKERIKLAQYELAARIVVVMYNGE